uniref:Uncharacterized protein n=1 Tax=Micrurus corallinus TaxID=54390 RepID=A0A2D4GGX1_MICCO
MTYKEGGMPSCGIKKTNRIYTSIDIRDMLIQSWRQIKNKYYLKIPNWISPLEAVVHPNITEIKKMARCTEILDTQGNLKSRQELEGWNKIGLVDVYANANKILKRQEFGINNGLQKLDKILIGPEEKLLSKIYKYLLEWDRTEEIVK